MNLRPGDEFDRRYVIERELGEGGFAKVYLARQGEELVALKILHRPTSGYDASTIARAKREAELLRQLDSPLLVKLHESAITADDHLYFVFEHVPGIDLSDLLARRGRLEPEEVRRVLAQVLEGLGVAHRRGLVHRDIKPQNIRVVDSDRLTVKLLDFGIARPTDGGASITKTGELVGTPRYMAPEQLTRFESSPASDIYSLGVVGFELLLGSDQLHGNELGDQLGRLRTGPLFAVPTEGTHPVWAVVERMTAHDVEARYASCAAALRALDGAKATGSVEHRPRRRSLGSLLPYVGAALALIAGLGVFMLYSRPQEPIPDPRETVEVAVRENPFGEQVDIAPADMGAVAPDSTTWDMAEARPVVPPRPSPGCSRKEDGEQTDPHLVVRHPALHDRSTPRPLLIFLHNDLVDPRHILELPDFAGFLDTKGIIVVAPQHLVERRAIASDRRRDAWRTPSDNERAVRGAYDWATDALCVDERRVFVFGHGTGGFAAMDGGCDDFATAVGVFAMPPRRRMRACNERPLIWLHPLHSPEVPARGGEGCRGWNALSVDDTLAELEAGRACTGSAPWPDEDARCTIHDCESPMAFCDSSGGGVWPGLEVSFVQLSRHGVDCAADTSPSFAVLPIAWRFFEQVVEAEAGKE